MSTFISFKLIPTIVTLDQKIQKFIKERKYELLLFGLLQHTFIAVFLTDLVFYTTYIWPINMVILVYTCYLVLWEKGNPRNWIFRILTFSVCLLPVIAFFTGFNQSFMEFLSIVYVVFFAYIFLNLMRFLVKPSYINTDILSASACGYLLLIEIMTFLLQTFFYSDLDSFKGIDVSGTAKIYIDFVYFSTITLTSIGFGDISPNSSQMKLLVSFFGLVGQFYTVVLVGILLSKFTSKAE